MEEKEVLELLSLQKNLEDIKNIEDDKRKILVGYKQKIEEISKLESRIEALEKSLKSYQKITDEKINNFSNRLDEFFADIKGELKDT